jgi:hypothetical protein
MIVLIDMASGSGNRLLLPPDDASVPADLADGSDHERIAASQAVDFL